MLRFDENGLLILFDSDYFQIYNYTWQLGKSECGADRKKRLLEEQDEKEIFDLICRFGGNIIRIAREMKVARSTIYPKK